MSVGAAFLENIFFALAGGFLFFTSNFFMGHADRLPS
jgi:hypothetical protein